jgi:hypothetical protein
MTDEFHFMTYKFHFMTEPTVVVAVIAGPLHARLLNERSFSIMASSRVRLEFLSKEGIEAA